MNELRSDHTSEQQPAELRPRVWLASLADYNAGTLTGEWVDAAVSEDELLAAARSVLARSETLGAEEWAIFDHDDFAGWTPGENEDLGIVARVARGIREHGAAFAAWATLRDADPSALEHFTDAYLGEHVSLQAWAEEVIEELGLQQRIDKAPRLVPLEG